ncbi:MAG: HemY protein [Pseudomonadota bacterium]|nr:HemY protein [Pseudomonadota bacterium]
MKIIAKFILIVGLAVFAALYANNVSGHVIIFLDRYRIDLLLTTMIIIIVLIYVLIYYMVRFWINIHKLPDSIRSWKSNKSLIKGRKYLNNAQINYLEGRFALSFKNAMESFARNKECDDKFLSLILAYKSANMMHDYKQEEEVFNKLIKYDDKKRCFDKLMVIADNQYTVHDYKACLDNLNLVLQLDKKHIPARVLMLKVHLKLNEFYRAREDLVWLIKHNLS